MTYPSSEHEDRKGRHAAEGQHRLAAGGRVLGGTKASVARCLGTGMRRGVIITSALAVAGMVATASAAGASTGLFGSDSHGTDGVTKKVTSVLGGTQLGTTTTTTATTATKAAPGTTVYPTSADARTFKNGTAGWTSVQEKRLLCVAPGITCIKWQFAQENTGGPNGSGTVDIKGPSLGLAPCIPEFAIARWTSPAFTYTNTNARNWTISYDLLKTFLLVGEGHDSMSVQILDENGNLVTTADAPTLELPWNTWQHHSVSFDGSKLAPGRKYRISFRVEVMQAEAAGGWGSFKVSNMALTVSDKPGTPPMQVCHRGGVTDPSAIVSSFEGILTREQAPDFCPFTSQVGKAASPLLNIGNQVMAQPALASLIAKGDGFLALASPITGDFFGWAVPPETAPTVDPRQLTVYLESGEEGEMGNYLVLFAVRSLHEARNGMNGPGGPAASLKRLLDGQLCNLEDVVGNPGQLIANANPQATFDSLSTSIQTAIGPLLKGGVSLPGVGGSGGLGLPGVGGSGGVGLPGVGGGGGVGLPGVGGSGGLGLPGLGGSGGSGSGGSDCHCANSGSGSLTGVLPKLGN